MPPLTKEEEAINRTRGIEKPGKNKQRRSPQEIAARREFVLAHSELPDRELLALAKKEGVHLKLHHVYYLRRLIKDGTLKKPKGKPGPKARAAAADLAPAPRAPRAAIVQPPSGRQDLEMQLLHAAFEIGFPTAMRLIADAQTVVAPALQSFLQNRK